MSTNSFNFILVQGRTLSQSTPQIQYFPTEWKDEFPVINELGFNGIEWIYDQISESTNPFLSDSGRIEMISQSTSYSVLLENIVFDWYITNPLFLPSIPLEKKTNKFLSLIDSSVKTGFKRIILPLLENNSVESISRQNEFLEFFKLISRKLDDSKIELHLETSLPPKKEHDFLKTLNHEKVKTCFDMGNSASFGYHPIEVLDNISDFLGSVHIKDRNLNGPSVPLGTGNVDFDSIFTYLKNIPFSGPFSFQTYRNQSSDNLKLLKDNLIFINNIIEND